MRLLDDDKLSWFDKRCFSSLVRSISFVVINGWLELFPTMASDIDVIPVEVLRSYDDVEFIRLDLIMLDK